MTFTIEYFVGKAYGGWFKGNARFPTREEAQQDCTDRLVREFRGELGGTLRRVVPA